MLVDTAFENVRYKTNNVSASNLKKIFFPCNFNTINWHLYPLFFLGFFVLFLQVFKNFDTAKVC